MATVDVTEENFAETIQGGIVLLDFWAGWCAPCRAFGPIFEAASERHPDIVFGKIDTEAQADLASAMRIQSIPTLMVLRDGILLSVQSGLMPGPALDTLILRVRSLNMDEVRRKLAVKTESAGTAVSN